MSSAVCGDFCERGSAVNKPAASPGTFHMSAESITSRSSSYVSYNEIFDIDCSGYEVNVKLVCTLNPLIPI